MGDVYPASNFAMAPSRIRSLVRASSLSALFCCLCAACAGQTSFATNPTRYLVCDKGVGSFQGSLPKEASGAGVTVSVGAAKKNGFAARACQAKLTWGKHELVVAPDAAQADIDVMGADLGLGSLVVAFQLKASETDPRIAYEIYSLSKPPQLLRTITGEDYFSAADTMLDGSVEIWTTDAAAIRGFEGLPLDAFDPAPTVILRFEKKKLIDVSSQFRSYFDREIETLHSRLDARQLNDFRQSDGKLSNEHWMRNHEPQGLLPTKVKVLEIVWCYLYSGREQEAWQTLAEMWPSSDLNRIRSAIVEAQARGLRAQVDGVSHNVLPFRQAQRAEIYEGMGSDSGFSSPSQYEHYVHSEHADTAPLQILLRLPPPGNAKHWAETKQMELIVDEAGKVRSARIMTPLLDKDAVPAAANAPGAESDKDWLDAAAGWKYIPAFKLSRPKSFHYGLVVRRDQ
jgi:hypothetical protein